VGKLIENWFMKVGHMKFLFLSLLIFITQLVVGADAGTYQGKGARPDTSYVIYIPEKLDLNKRHPWILGFSPDGNGMEALAAMQQGCDDNGWILVASNNSKNGVNFNIIEPFITDTINSAVRTLAVDPYKMYVGGLSGGGMVSHWFIANYPQLVKGAVINCGMMSRDVQREKGYPSGKDIVFMTNPDDFRYKEIRADFQYVTARGCKASWLEFPGGHRWAPPGCYSTAFKWLNAQAKLHN
jgi:pimeloyl-ACP methyl ester carboxylesterase